MLPLLPAGARIVAWPLSGPSQSPVRRGLVVVARRPDQPSIELIKRIGAVAGETVRLPDGSAHMLRPGEYFLVGDNLAASTDSRHFGPVPRDHLIAVIRWRYWPLPPRPVG